MLISKTDILDRWTEYIGELYGDERPELTPNNINEDGPPILEQEVEDAIKHMKKGKATGPYRISVEELEALGDIGIKVIQKFLNDIYDSGYIPDNLLKSNFIVLPKKSGAKDCDE